MENMRHEDVADLFGVNLGTVKQWRQRHFDFPDASDCDCCGYGPVFDRAAVVAWGIQTKRITMKDLYAHDRRVDLAKAES